MGEEGVILPPQIWCRENRCSFVVTKSADCGFEISLAQGCGHKATMVYHGAHSKRKMDSPPLMVHGYPFRTQGCTKKPRPDPTKVSLRHTHTQALLVQHLQHEESTGDPIEEVLLLNKVGVLPLLGMQPARVKTKLRSSMHVGVCYSRRSSVSSVRVAVVV